MKIKMLNKIYKKINKSNYRNQKANLMKQMKIFWMKQKILKMNKLIQTQLNNNNLETNYRIMKENQRKKQNQNKLMRKYIKIIQNIYKMKNQPRRI